ncbi:MAG: hypothetical protein DSY42_03345 [Aquifex sp.]|nr:MAG: hypothetical protein DSY42_03345 [Aquifex sp.]
MDKQLSINKLLFGILIKLTILLLNISVIDLSFSVENFKRQELINITDNLKNEKYINESIQDDLNVDQYEKYKISPYGERYFEGRERIFPNIYRYPEKSEEYSYIEKKFFEKIKDKKIKLKQFGYDIFKNVGEILKAPIPVGNDYILGPGDEVIIYFWGDPVDVLGLESYYKLKIDREGKLFIPYVGIVYAWGKTVKDFEKELKKLLAKKFRRFKVEVSVGALRTFPVYVSGYVNKPGVVLAQGTYTVIEALAAAGGVSKNGSLRNILLRRASGKKIRIDLYKLLIKGEPINIRLKDGDIIFVEEIGPTVGIAGSVKRPAIYEVTKDATIGDLIELAGGVLFSAYNYGVKLFRYENNELKVYNGDLTDSKFLQQKLKDGDFVFIEELYELVENYVEVKGHIKYPGKYSVNHYKNLSSLIDVIELLPDTNLYYAELIRKDLSTGKVTVRNFVPKYIIEGKQDLELKPFDVVVFYPKWIYSPITISGEVENPLVIPYYPEITLLDALREVKFKDDYRNLKALVYVGDVKNFKDDKNILESSEGNPGILEEIAEASAGLIERKAKVVYLYDLFTRGKNNITLFPGTKILIKRTEPTEKDKVVTILGEVKKPGIYRIEKGMRLYDIIVKAGGFTENAYPRGLIFIRRSAKELQEQHLKIAITALEEGLLKADEGFSTAGGTSEERMIIQLTLNRQKQLLRIIKEKAKIGLGRIALDIPERLEDLKNSPSNILLEDGDYIYIPPRPNYILVLGEVYNQISLPYIKGKPLSYYLELVGGTTPNADLENIYVIKANGRVVSRRSYNKLLSFEWSNGKLYFGRDFVNMPLEEGDTIVVPTKLRIPVLWRPLIRDVVQIIFQAISTAVLAKRL